MERRQELCRHLSESESSLEMEEERQFNELSSHGQIPAPPASAAAAVACAGASQGVAAATGPVARARTISNPITHRPVSPAFGALTLTQLRYLSASRFVQCREWICSSLCFCLQAV